ncbi:hypothetical protein ACQ4PT_035398 [Festuca glaucescens]
MSSPSSSSRRWNDYTDDEEDEVPRRSYCEVLRSGSPPVESGSGAAASSVAPRGVASPATGPGGVDPSTAVAAAGRPWAVDDGVRQLASLVVLPGRRSSPATRPPPPGARPWVAARGHKRPRGQQATLPAWTIHSGIPSNFAGACFNCTRTCHISAECTYETVCLRCGEEGHHARACPQNRRVGGDRREAQGRGTAAPVGQSVQQRLGPREQLPAAAVAQERGALSGQEARVEVAPGRTAVEPSREAYRIPARQRAGLDAQLPRQGLRTPSPPPVELAGTRLPARMRLGVRERERSPPPPPPPPPVQEAVGASSRVAPRERPAGGGSPRRRALESRRQDAASLEAWDVAEQCVAARQARDESRSRRDQRARTAEVESVFVSRSEEINVAEAALRYARMAFVSWSRAYIPMSEAGAALAARVPRAEDNFTVHRSWPADFLFVCSSRRVRDEIMAADAAHG